MSPMTAPTGRTEQMDACETMTEQEAALVLRLLAERIYWLRNQIREQDSLSEPCPAGRGRWADVNTSGYGRKSETELAKDRQRAAERAAQYRAELATALSAQAALR